MYSKSDLHIRQIRQTNGAYLLRRWRDLEYAPTVCSNPL